METVRLAILDSHQLVRDTLAEYLAHQGCACAFVEHDPASFLSRLIDAPVDVAIIEPILDPRTEATQAGFDAMSALHDRFPSVRALVLTRAATREALDRAYEVGAMGFLYKPAATPQAVLEAVQAAARGERRFPAELLDGFARRVAHARPLDRTEIAALTDREREVLGHIAAGHDNLKIGALMGISERTVKSHVAAIYRKLRLENRVQLALRARELGLSATSA